MRASTTFRGGARVSRRRLLRGATLVAAGLSGAALIGCGSSAAPPTAPAGTTGAGAGAATGATTATAAATSGPRQGGTLRLATTTDPPTLDPYGSGSFATKGFAAYVYSRLFRIDAQPNTNPHNQPLTGDLAEKYETTDGQTWTVTLRQGAKFHDIAPVSGREVTTDDVAYSWGRLTAKTSVNAAAVENVEKAEVVDAHTLRFTLKAPSPVFLNELADANNLWIMPTESESQFQPTIKPVGSGPWIMDQYQVSSRIKFKRHPGYLEPNIPYLDGVDLAIIPEYANQKAQMEGGNLDVFTPTADDVIDLHASHGTSQWLSQVVGSIGYLFFSPPDKDPSAPWRDERYRRAVSMSLDRGAIMQLAYSVSDLKAAGLSPSEAWNNVIAVALGKWWVDPQSAEQGPSAAYFKYDAAEAKKMLAAVGGSDAPLKWQYASPVYGAAFDHTAEAVGNWLHDAGFPVTTEIQDYKAVYFPQTRAGNFNGLAMGITPEYPEVSGYVDRFFSKASSNAGKVDDPQLTDLRAKQAVEFDDATRVGQIKDVQRRNADMMFYVPMPLGGGTTWTVYDRRVQDVALTTGYGAPTEVTARLWLSA